MYLSVSRNQIQDQRKTCIKFGAIPFPPRNQQTVLIARKTFGSLPINGLRHSPQQGSSGWRIWCGSEYPQDLDFFQVSELSPLLRHMPEIERFLALPPGYRFLLAGAHVEVWYDAALTK